MNIKGLIFLILEFLACDLSSRRSVRGRNRARWAWVLIQSCLAERAFCASSPFSTLIICL